MKLFGTVANQILRECWESHLPSPADQPLVSPMALSRDGVDGGDGRERYHTSAIIQYLIYFLYL